MKNEEFKILDSMATALTIGVPIGVAAAAVSVWMLIGLATGRLTVENAAYERLWRCRGVELRRYEPSVVARVQVDSDNIRLASRFVQGAVLKAPTGALVLSQRLHRPNPAFPTSPLSALKVPSLPSPFRFLSQLWVSPNRRVHLRQEHSLRGRWASHLYDLPSRSSPENSPTGRAHRRFGRIFRCLVVSSIGP